MKTWNGLQIVDKLVYVDGIVGRTSKETIGKTSKDHLLLTDVFVNGKFFRDHAWISLSRRFKNAKPQKNQRIFFTASTCEYIDPSSSKNKIGFTNKRNIIKSEKKAFSSGWDRKNEAI